MHNLETTNPLCAVGWSGSTIFKPLTELWIGGAVVRDNYPNQAVTNESNEELQAEKAFPQSELEPAGPVNWFQVFSLFNQVVHQRTQLSLALTTWGIKVGRESKGLCSQSNGVSTELDKYDKNSLLTCLTSSSLKTKWQYFYSYKYFFFRRSNSSFVFSSPSF